MSSWANDTHLSLEAYLWDVLSFLSVSISLVQQDFWEAFPACFITPRFEFSESFCPGLNPTRCSSKLPWEVSLDDDFCVEFCDWWFCWLRWYEGGAVGFPFTWFSFAYTPTIFCWPGWGWVLPGVSGSASLLPVDWRLCPANISTITESSSEKAGLVWWFPPVLPPFTFCSRKRRLDLADSSTSIPNRRCSKQSQDQSQNKDQPSSRNFNTTLRQRLQIWSTGTFSQMQSKNENFVSLLFLHQFTG